jgi:hypothetical protein
MTVTIEDTLEGLNALIQPCSIELIGHETYRGKTGFEIQICQPGMIPTNYLFDSEKRAVKFIQDMEVKWKLRLAGIETTVTDVIHEIVKFNIKTEGD